MKISWFNKISYEEDDANRTFLTGPVYLYKLAEVPCDACGIFSVDFFFKSVFEKKIKILLLSKIDPAVWPALANKYKYKKHDSMQDDLNVVLIFDIICCVYLSI